MKRLFEGEGERGVSPSSALKFMDASSLYYLGTSCKLLHDIVFRDRRTMDTIWKAHFERAVIEKAMKEKEIRLKWTDAFVRQDKVDRRRPPFYVSQIGQNKGRGAKANRDIEPQEQILRVYPAASALKSCFASSSCSFCFCELDKEDCSRMCMKCNSFNVCERCAKMAPDFMTWHRTECEWLDNWRRDASEEMMTLPTEYLRFIFRFALLKAKGPPSGIFRRDIGKIMPELCCDFKKLPKEQCQTLMFLAKTASKACPLIRGPTAFALLVKRVLNAHGISRGKGWMIVPSASFFNHSCSPNAKVLIAPNGMLSVRALKSIRKDEEILISYVDPSRSRDARREYLMGTFCFLCQCSRCEPCESSK